MSAGLVDGRDLVIGRAFTNDPCHLCVCLLFYLFFSFFTSVAANLRKIVDEPQTNKNVTFKLVSVSES